MSVLLEKPGACPDNAPPWFKFAYDHYGEKEIKGAKDNPFIRHLWAAIDFGERSDEVPWCSIFINAMLVAVGQKGTGSPMAITFEKYGVAVNLSDVQLGDIVVLHRFGAAHYVDHPHDWRRHVGFFAGLHADGKVVRLLGGNQHDMVCEADFPASRITAIRRPGVVADLPAADYDAMLKFKADRLAKAQAAHDKLMADSVKGD